MRPAARALPSGGGARVSRRGIVQLIRSHGVPEERLRFRWLSPAKRDEARSRDERERRCERTGGDPHVEPREERRQDEQRRELHEAADDDHSDRVQPTRVDPRAEDGAVVAEKQQEHRCARKEDAGEGLYAGRHEPER